MNVVAHIRQFATDCVREAGYAVVVPTVVALVVSLGTQLLPAGNATAAAQPTPTLAQAVVEPDLRVRVPRGGDVTIGEQQCDGGEFFTDTQAYRTNGRTLGAQRWNADHTVTSWRGQGGRVTFDGVTFTNKTTAAVVVAAWCA